MIAWIGTINIVGASRPAHSLARLVRLLADHLQNHAVRRYLAAMRALTRD